MRKFYIVGLVVIACLIIGLAYAEQITFSTYYPAPFGVYREMRTIRHAIGDTYYKAGDHPWDEDGFPISGEIDQDADLVVEGNVGIGTTDPEAKLDVVSTASGFLPPRMTDVQLAAIETTAAEGSVAYNTTDEELNYRDSTGWQPIGGGGGEFGDWNTVDPESAPIRAVTDGFFIGVIKQSWLADKGIRIYGYSGINSSPTTLRGAASVWSSRDNVQTHILANSFSIPVKNGNYYKASHVYQARTNTYTVPLGGQTINYYWVPAN